MSLVASIPASFLIRARRHLNRTGRPLVYGPRRRSDIGLFACPNPVSARWVLVTDTSSLPAPVKEAILVNERREVGPSAELMVRLTKYAAVVAEGLPSRFECEGLAVGHMEVADNCCVFVSSALAVSCLSWWLRNCKPRTGFFLVGPEQPV
jgi:hypothetical protein